MPRILAFSGSARKDSFNQRLVTIAARAAEEAGAEVTLLNLADYPLPIFNEDLEAEGTPDNALKLKKLFLAHDGLLISCPEYNSSITPLLKNTIDWVSRPIEGEPRLAAYQYKVATLMAASPGALGGLRGLVHVRAILQNIGVTVLPGQVAVGGAAGAFAADGSLKDEKQQASIASLGSGLANYLQRLSD
ncbi:NADPH azoreductase [Pseudobythopirellula maris]|uniref:NADPH azoreductase n=1 Tax=Pseudobythopirellula maris TaxID=2527991 RepID=A0A5C5ZRI5_9BACT|nr:NAD(P)H-dependent oxidoreductase [Pseudobythopirellula maris]TWT89668.1 NADPH azoreductase [Pseudobythopirellula maris]